MPGICKVGATRKHPIQRARELGSPTGVPGPYTLAYYRDFVDCFRAEALIHSLLEESRVNESREFFAIGPEEAIQTIDEVARRSLADKRLESSGMIGGEGFQKKVKTVETPWAELFASFAPSDDPFLTPKERTQCRALEKMLRS